MNAYTGNQYISQTLARASADRASVFPPAAATRLERVVATRPPRGAGKPPSGMQALELRQEDCRRLGPHRPIERQGAGEKLLAAMRQIGEARVGRHPRPAQSAAEWHRRERM